MKVVAKTKDGYLIEATYKEIYLIAGTKTEVKSGDIAVGLEISATSLRGTYKELRELKDSYELRSLKAHTKAIDKAVDNIMENLKAF